MAVLTVQSVRILTPPTTAIAPACSSEAVASAAFALVFAPPSLDVSPPTKLPLAHGGSVRSRKPPRLQPFYCGGGGSARCHPKRPLPPTTHVRAGCPRSFFAAEDPRTHSARLPSPSLAIWAVAVRWPRRVLRILMNVWPVWRACNCMLDKACKMPPLQYYSP